MDLNTRQLQAKNTKNLILNSLLDLLNSKSFAQITVKEICDKANISVGGFYHHYRNKYEILIDCQKQYERNFVDNLNIDEIKGNYVAKILFIYTKQIEESAENLNLFFNFFKAQLDYGEKYLLNSDRKMPQLITGLIESAKANNEIDLNKDSFESFNEIAIIVRGILFQTCLCNGKGDIKKLINNLLKPYLESL